MSIMRRHTRLDALAGGSLSDPTGVARVLAKATHIIEPNGGRPIDVRGDLIIERGDTEDGAYLARINGGELGIFQPYNQGTERGFTMADNAIMDGADVTARCVFRVPSLAADVVPLGKFNANGNRKEWALVVDTSGDLRFQISDDGSTDDDIDAVYGGIGTLAVDTWYAVQAVYDESAGTVTWTTHTVADGAAGEWGNGTGSEVDSDTPITMHNDTAPLSVGGISAGASSDSLGSPSGVVRYAQVIFDGGTVTIDPHRDAQIGDTSWVDADSGLTCALQTTTAQTDWPTLSGSALYFDGADLVRTNYGTTGKFAAGSGEWSVVVVCTPSTHASWKRLLSAESANGDGLVMMRYGAADQIALRLGGDGTDMGPTGKPFVEDTRTVLGMILGGGKLYTLTDDGFEDQGSTAGVGTITHSDGIFLGDSGFGGAAIIANIELVLIFEFALTETEALSLQAQL
ncbi:MAG: hypothetical protein GY773_17995 [Actinomycetia bacterium]|nr:hypothetical protein [Actinomycetes bacterium]